MIQADPALLDLLRCPLCKGPLESARESLRCAACNRSYPIVLGIPDLRIYEDPLIPLQDDYRKGEKLQLQAERLSFAELVRYYWSLPTYPPTPPELAERFIRHVLSDTKRIDAYEEKLGRGESFLEVGCGTAALVPFAGKRFKLAIGSDIAFRWLVVARKRLEEAGTPANLVCCCADYLPFPRQAFSSVASVALLEHVTDAGSVLNEFSRVTRTDGRIFAWTSNRFSLAPEPHVRVWGVGFLPRRWMPAYVKWRSGLAYEKKCLLSYFELRNLTKKSGLDWLEFSLPAITPADWESLKGLERVAGRIFSWVSHIGMLRLPLVIISPVLQLVARRRTAAAVQERAADVQSRVAAK